MNNARVVMQSRLLSNRFLRTTGVALVAAALLAGTASCDGGDSEYCSGSRNCTRAEYCKSEDGSCESVGECENRPEVCAEIYAPVCGCDGQIYSNACTAAAAGISVDKPQRCGVEMPISGEVVPDMMSPPVSEPMTEVSPLESELSLTPGQ